MHLPAAEVQRREERFAREHLEFTYDEVRVRDNRADTERRHRVQGEGLYIRVRQRKLNQFVEYPRVRRCTL